MKILWIDTETLSLDPNTGDIIQLAGFIQVNGEVDRHFNWFIKPDKYDPAKIDPEVWEFHKNNSGITEEFLMEHGKDSSEAYKEFKELLQEYVPNSRDRSNRLAVGGYNVKFDLDKLSSWFRDNGDPYLFAYLKSVRVDPFYLLPMLLPACQDLPSLKLESVWDFLVKADIIEDLKNKRNHDARTDIAKTLLIWNQVLQPIQEYCLRLSEKIS